MQLAAFLKCKESSDGDSASLEIMSQSAKPRNVNDLASESCFSEQSENIMFVYKQFQLSKKKRAKAKDDQKIQLFGSAKNKKEIGPDFGKEKTQIQPKRIQSLKKVFKGLGLSGRNLFVDTNLKPTDIQKAVGLTPCEEEIDDEICAKILKHHGLAQQEEVDSTLNSLATLSEASVDSLSSDDGYLEPTQVIQKGNIPSNEFKEILTEIKKQCPITPEVAQDDEEEVVQA